MKAAFAFLCAFLLVSCSESGTDSKLDVPEPTSSDNSGDKPVNMSAELRGVLLDGTFFEEGLSRNLVFSPKIELVELDEKLTQAGHIADGTIDLLGNYTVSTEGFEKRYAELSVFGKATPLCSADPAEFRYSIIVDLASDSVVNISYLAHLASARAKWLMKNEQMDFDDAWKKAEKETHETFALSEEFAPIRSGALAGQTFAIEALSVSVLAELAASRMALSPNDMRERVTDEFARYGTRAVRDTVGNLMFLAYTAFRKTHVMDEFYDCDLFRLRVGMEENSRNQERLLVYNHVDTLWQAIRGESKCDASLDGRIHAFTDSSNLKLAQQNFPFFTGEEYYICRENRWVFLRSLEYIQYIYPDYDNGGIRMFKNDMFVFEEGTGWRYADSVEYKLRVSCTKDFEGNEFNSTYICHDGHWQLMNVDSVYAITCNDEGKPIQKGKVIEGYICDSGKAFSITSMDVLLDKYCTDFNKGEIVSVGYSRALCGEEDWKWVADPLDSLTDSRDGTVYPIIGIGNQRWLGKNLMYSDSSANENLAGNIWCNYSCAGAGVFYSWTAAMDLPDGTDIETLEIELPHRGICPEGWHISSRAEWNSLLAFVEKYDISDSPAVRSLMNGNWPDYTKSRNTFGLSIPSTGRRTVEGDFEKTETNAYYWVATAMPNREAEGKPNKLPFVYMTQVNKDLMSGIFGDTKWGEPIRCVADEEN